MLKVKLATKRNREGEFSLGLPPFPQKMEGSLFFQEIMPQFVQEYNPFKLAMLGLIVEKKGLQDVYEPLKFSLRKIQWVKLVGLKATHIEQELLKQVTPDTLAFDPLRQTAHSLCITDCLIHTKSALDSMAVFLTNKLGLVDKKGIPWRGGHMDFKWLEFRQSICQKDMFLKQKIKKLEPWFIELQGIRDEWIHIKAIQSISVHGKSEVGMLPVPKNIGLNSKEKAKLPFTSQYFWSTKDFVEHHYVNLSELFREIVDRCVQIENLDLCEPVTVPQHFMNQLTLFPMHVTENMTIKQVKVYLTPSLTDW
jgi:hypothetical protein